MLQLAWQTWSLQINAAKTEQTSVSRQVDRAYEPWRTTRKLGSLLGDRRRGPPNSPSTKCGQSGSEGPRLVFICGYGSTQHSSCLYLHTTWASRKQSSTDSMRIIVVTCGRSSVSAGHTVYQTTHSTDVLNPAPLVPLSGLLDGACSDMSSDCHWTPQFSALSMPTWKTPAPPKFRGRPRCTLPTTLGENLRHIGRQLRNSDDIDALCTLDRRTWRDLGRELALINFRVPPAGLIYMVGVGLHSQLRLRRHPAHTSIIQQPYTNTR